MLHFLGELANGIGSGKMLFDVESQRKLSETIFERSRDGHLLLDSDWSRTKCRSSILSTDFQGISGTGYTNIAFLEHVRRCYMAKRAPQMLKLSRAVTRKLQNLRSWKWAHWKENAILAYPYFGNFRDRAPAGTCG